MHTVQFLPSGARVEVPAGTSLLDAAVAAGLPIARSCAADGLCSRCAVRVLSGAENLSPASPDEQHAKQRNRVEPELRLACRASVRGDVVITAAYW